jgi:hypothetical protein
MLRSRYALFLTISMALLMPTLSLADTPEPVRVIEDTLRVPKGLDAAEALSAVQDLSPIFDLYEPVVPWIPGVKLDLEKERLVGDGDIQVELPVQGAAFGRAIEERASVTATTAPLSCDEEEGLQITLSFEDSTPNIARRIDRIEISACPRIDEDGTIFIDAVGALYAGPLPRDPKLNAFNENIGAKALQTAFLKQVPAVFDAVETHWEYLNATSS